MGPRRFGPPASKQTFETQRYDRIEEHTGPQENKHGASHETVSTGVLFQANGFATGHDAASR